MYDFVSEHSVRLAALLAAHIPLLVAHWPRSRGRPWSLLLLLSSVWAKSPSAMWTPRL
jgi:hypothetical protein